MANYENVAHDSIRLGLGDNEFRTGVITLAAGASAVAGAIVQTSDGKFVASAGADTETGLGVVVEDVKNSGSAFADIPVRVMISGKVNQNALYIGTTKATAAQADLLRKWSIVPVAVKEF